MKALVNSLDGQIRGIYDEPLDFSIAGNYVIDIPSTISLKPTLSSASAFILAKIEAIRALHPGTPNEIHSEFLLATDADSTLSDRCLIGPNKGTALLNSGATVMTPICTTSVSFGTIWFHFCGFRLYHQAMNNLLPANTDPPPSRYLYNHDEGSYVAFDPADVRVDLMDSTGVSVLATLTPDSENTYVSAVPLSFRLRFTNLTNDRINLSDWAFLYGT